MFLLVHMKVLGHFRNTLCSKENEGRGRSVVCCGGRGLTEYTRTECLVSMLNQQIVDKNEDWFSPGKDQVERCVINLMKVIKLQQSSSVSKCHREVIMSNYC